MEAIYPAADQIGYSVVLGARVPTFDEQRVVAGLLGSRCAGLIVLGAETSTAQLRTLAVQVPVTVVLRRGDNAGVDGVRGADVRGAVSAVDLLVELGHRRIQHVDGGSNPGAADRRRGYRAAMHRHHLTADVVRGDWTEESGVRAARTLMAARRDRPDGVTAVLAGNDRCAVGLLDTLRRAGVDVPGQVSVVGYDDSRLAGLAHIDLTTVAQDPIRMAQLAVEAVVGRVQADEPLPVRDFVVVPQLVIRTTTGPAPTRPDPVEATGPS